MSAILSCLFLKAFSSPAGKGLTFLVLLYVMFSCVFVTFPYGVLGQEEVWYLIVLILDLCFFPYYVISLFYIPT